MNNWSGSLFPATPEQGIVIFTFSFETSLQICLKEERDRGKQGFILTWRKKSETHRLTLLAFPHLSPSASWQGRAWGCLAGRVHRFLISQGQESDFSLLLSSFFSAPPSFPNYFDGISKTRASFFVVVVPNLSSPCDFILVLLWLSPWPVIIIFPNCLQSPGHTANYLWSRPRVFCLFLLDLRLCSPCLLAGCWLPRLDSSGLWEAL